MKELITSYLDILLNQRAWSWTLVAITYIVVGLWIRSLFLRPLVRRLKSLEKKHYQEVKKAYLKRSVGGWLLFCLSLALMISLWFYPLIFPLSLRQTFVLFTVVAGYVLSVVLHLIALGIATITTLKGILGTQDDL
jgi:hypothetical protein